jgi:hypothetical protein
MRQKSVPEKEPATQVVKNIRRATRRHFSAEDKIRIVLEGLRGDDDPARVSELHCSNHSDVENNHPAGAPQGSARFTLHLGLRGRRSQLSYHLVPGPPRQVIPAFNGRRPKWQVLP